MGGEIRILYLKNANASKDSKILTHSKTKHPIGKGLNRIKKQKGKLLFLKRHMLFTLNEARDEIDNMDNKEVRNALSIIELLKKNLDLWKEEEGGEDNAAEDL